VLKKRSIFTIVMAVGALLCKGQQFNFHNLVQHPASECYKVLQDSKGYLWFGTEKGLYRYDGSTYKCFNVTNGMPDNDVFNIMEDSKGRILFYGLSGIICYISHDSVIIPSFNKSLTKLLGNGRFSITDFYQDSSQTLWISSLNGLYKASKPGYNSDVEVLPLQVDSCVTGISIIEDKEALVSNYNLPVKVSGHVTFPKLFISNHAISHIIPFIGNDLKQVSNLHKTLFLSNGNTLVSFDSCIYTFLPNGNYMVKSFSEKIISLYKDKSGGVWIGFHNGGVAYYKNGSLTGIPVWSLSGYSVSSIIMDNENGVWATTLEKGIFYAPSKNVIDFSNNACLDNKISALAIKDHEVVANDYSGTPCVIRQFKASPFNMNGINKFDAVNKYLFNNDKLYVGTTASFLQSDTSLKKWTEIRFTGHGRNLGTIAYDISGSPSNRIYAVTHRDLLILDNDSLHRLAVLPARGQSIYVTSKNEILVGCINGLYKYANDKFTYLGEGSKPLSSRINMIKEDKAGNMWIATGGFGLIEYKNGQVVKAFTTQNGLAADYCNDIAFDKDGNTWVATDKGLSKIYPSKNYFIETFDTRHGLISDEITRLAIDSNILWIGTGNGLCAMNILNEKRNTVPPPVYISSVTVNDSIHTTSTQYTYNLNDFRFSLCSLTFKDNEHRFLYRLIGLDTTWHFTSNLDIPFNNLSPGNYRFEAKAVNADGVSSEKAAMFSFSIDKPFWKKWWFILVEILISGTLIYLFLRFRLITIQKKEEEKTKINKMLAEYQLTALRTQMNPHFIFNVINSIQDYVLENNPKQAYDYLAMFSHLIRMMLNASQEQKLNLQQELEMLKIYIELEQMRFSKSFEFILNMDEKIDTRMVSIPTMLIQPYVENAIWHGLMNLKGTRNGMLKIDISKNGELKIIIEDNGVGREQAMVLRKNSSHKSMGMELNRKRVELLNNMPGQVKAAVNITDLYDQQQHACGTRVEITIPETLL
jgi:ligand-binding sensor domain-containing protein